MRRAAATIAGCAAGYLLGSMPFGLWLGRSARGVDVREHGSGSSGATNVLRVVGPAAAATVFLLDVGKGTGAVLVARRLGAGGAGEALAGLAVVTGHAFPCLAEFRGGKGVATGFGALMAISPEATASAVSGGTIAVISSQTVSVGSLTATLGATVGAAVLCARGGSRVPLGYCLPVAALITWRHSGNLRRLARDAEPKLSLRRARAARS